MTGHEVFELLLALLIFLGNAAGIVVSLLNRGKLIDIHHTQNGLVAAVTKVAFADGVQTQKDIQEKAVINEAIAQAVENVQRK